MKDSLNVIRRLIITNSKARLLPELQNNTKVRVARDSKPCYARITEEKLTGELFLSMLIIFVELLIKIHPQSLSALL